MCRLTRRRNVCREKRPLCWHAKKAVQVDNREIEQVDTQKTPRHNYSFSHIFLCMPFLFLMYPDLPRCFLLYFIKACFPVSSCRPLYWSPQKSHYNPQILLNVTMCHSICQREPRFEREAESICAIVNSVRNNSFGAFSLFKM